jgi:shikimate dehydrogenase
VRALPGRLVLLGHPVAHSVSPIFQNAALRQAAIPLVYEPLDVTADALGEVIATLRHARAAGNVTIPHKEAVAARCDRRMDNAKRVGAVNTFWMDEGALVGDNTDIDGFDAQVRATLGATPTGIRVALLGAGGGARAVLGAMERWRDCSAAIYNRTMERAAELTQRFPFARVEERIDDALRGAMLVVNATSVGMADDRYPAALEAIERDAAVIDLVYRRGETPWVRGARAKGHRASDGKMMLLEQGALAFERWFERPAPRDSMRQALESRR